MQWALRILGDSTHTVNVYGGGYWVFFNDFGGCPGDYCQDQIVDLENLRKGDGVVLYNVNTRGVKDPIVIGGSGGTVGAAAADNPGSWGAAVGAFLGYE
jgi:glucan 1,3-beta-glucosidase